MRISPVIFMIAYIGLSTPASALQSDVRYICNPAGGRSLVGGKEEKGGPLDLFYFAGTDSSKSRIFSNILPSGWFEESPHSLPSFNEYLYTGSGPQRAALWVNGDMKSRETEVSVILAFPSLQQDLFAQKAKCKLVGN